MNRRNFLKYSSSAMILPVVTNTLNADINIEKHLFPSNVSNTELILDLPKDVFLDDKYLIDFQSVRDKLILVQNYVGYGNFNIISFDNMLRISKNVSGIEPFTKSEIDFIERFFYYNPADHGFFGKRISNKITQTINKKK